MNELPWREDSLLGGLLVALIHNPDVAGPLLAELQPDHFSQEVNRILFAAVITLHQDGSDVNLVSLSEYLWKREQLWDIGDGYDSLIYGAVLVSQRNYRKWSLSLYRSRSCINRDSA